MRIKILRGDAEVACKAHNLEVGSSILPPATNLAGGGESRDWVTE